MVRAGLRDQPRVRGGLFGQEAAQRGVQAQAFRAGLVRFEEVVREQLVDEARGDAQVGGVGGVEVAGDGQAQRGVLLFRGEEVPGAAGDGVQAASPLSILRLEGGGMAV